MNKTHTFICIQQSPTPLTGYCAQSIMAAALERKLQITIKLKLDDADASNYTAWRKQAEAVLRAYGYFNWIDGDSEPVISDNEHKVSNITKRDNAFALLLCSIDESCMFIVDDCNTPW